MNYHDDPVVIEIRTSADGAVEVLKVHACLTPQQEAAVLKRLEGFNPGDATFRLVADRYTGKWHNEVWARSLDKETASSLTHIIFDPLRVELHLQTLH